MPSKKTAATTETPRRRPGRPSGSGQTAAPQTGELDGADPFTQDVDAALAEIGSEALEVVLFQQDATAPTEWPYLARFPANDFSLEAIKVQHGGGKYRARILGPGKKFVRQITFQIHRSFKAAQAAPQPSAATGGASDAPTVLLPVLEALRQNAELSRAMLTEVRELKAGAAVPRTDPLEYALKINALITQNTRQTSGFSEILTVLEKGMELGSGGGSQPDNSGGYAAVISQFGAPLLEYLRRIAEKENAPTGPQLVRNFPPPQPAEPENPNPSPIMPTPGAPAWLIHLRPLIPYGLQLAASGAEPESFAPALYQIIPDAALEAIEGAVSSDPNFSLAVLEAYPDTQQHRDWFVRLLGAVREIILENQKEADPSQQAATG